MKTPKTRAGSRAHRLAELVLARSREIGRGLTAGEIYEAYAAVYGDAPPKNVFNADISMLVRRRVLLRAGGRPRSTLYRHHADAAGVRPDDAEAVLAALKRAYKRLGRPLSTREVAEEIERGKQPLRASYANAVRSFLVTLAGGRGRGSPKSRTARVRMLSSPTASGRPACFWVPAKPSVPGSRAEAVRGAVETTSLLLGYPPSIAEIALWAEAHASSDPRAQALEPARLRRDLAATVSADRRGPGKDGRIHVVASHWHCHGGPPRRYTLRSPDEIAVATTAFLEGLERLRPAAEVAGIAALERRAAVLRSEALGDLAQLRKEALSGALGAPLAEVDPETVFARLDEGLGHCHEWLSSARLTGDQAQKRRYRLAHLKENLAAARRLVINGGALEIKLVGEVATVAPVEIEPLLRSAALALRVPADSTTFLGAARRFPVPESPGTKRFGQAADFPLSLLDRVDLVSAVFSAVPVLQARALVTAAATTLGHVVRDARVLMEILERVSKQEAAVRRELGLALALLGELVPASVAVPDRSDPLDTRAFVLAAVIADPGSAADVVSAVHSRATGAAQQVAATAASRLRAGLAVSVIG